MAIQNINAIHIQLHDTEANWSSDNYKAFVPLKGQIVIYDTDLTHSSERVKIGDGSSKVGDLPFLSNEIPGRKEDTTVGENSLAVGSNNTAAGDASFVSGKDNTVACLGFRFKIIDEAAPDYGFKDKKYYINVTKEQFNNLDTTILSSGEKYCLVYTSGYVSKGTVSAIEWDESIGCAYFIDELDYYPPSKGDASKKLQDYSCVFFVKEEDVIVSGETDPVKQLKPLDIGVEHVCDYAHAEGYKSLASGYASHAEGQQTVAFGVRSHAEGWGGVALGNNNHVEGYLCVTNKSNSHAEGYKTNAFGQNSHTEGRKSIVEAAAKNSHAEGSSTLVRSESSHSEGYITQTGSHAFEFDVNNEYNYDDEPKYYLTSVDGIADALSNYKTKIEGSTTLTNREKENKKLYYTMVLGGNYDYYGEITAVDTDNMSIIVDNYIKPLRYTGNETHNYRLESGHSYLFLPNYPELGTMLIGAGSHSEGYETKARSIASHAEGYETIAAGKYSHAEGKQTKAGYAAHAEGRETLAKGENTHAEGVWTRAIGNYSHAEGKETEALGGCSHTEGMNTRALGNAAHAEGGYSEANANRSHAEGSTIAGSEFQHTQGKYNVIDNEGKYAHIVGNGKGSTQRSNAHTVDWDGNAWYAGSVAAEGQISAKKGICSKDILSLDDNGNTTEISSLVGQIKDVVLIPEAGNYPKEALIEINTQQHTISIPKVRVPIGSGYLTIIESSTEYKSTGFTPSLFALDVANKTFKFFARNDWQNAAKEDKFFFNNFLPIFFFNPGDGYIKNGVNISYTGPYSIDGITYNAKIKNSSGDVTEKVAEVVKYVSNSGNDNNSGSSETTAYRTINKAVESDADIICIAPGVYPEYVKITNKSRVHLMATFGTSNNKRSKVIISDAIDCDFTIKDNIAIYNFTTTNQNLKTAFSNDTTKVNAYTSYNYANADNGRSKGYIYNLWRVSDNKKIIPVSSKKIVEESSSDKALYWYSDGSTIYTNAGAGTYKLSNSIDLNNITLTTATDGDKVIKFTGDPTSGLFLKDIQNLIISDVDVNYPQFEGIKINNCGNANVINCSANYSSLSNGLSINSSNGVFEYCGGKYNRNDGINITACGHTVFNNCEAHYNYDDGISHHTNCTGTINGGRYTHNVKGGVAPAHGAVVNCYNVVCENNGVGFYCVSDTAEGRSYNLVNCVAKNNNPNGYGNYADIMVSKYHINLYNCTYDTTKKTESADTSLNIVCGKIDSIVTLEESKWTRSSGRYYQEVAVNGIHVGDHPVIDVEVDENNIDGCLTAWENITRAKCTKDNTITFYADNVKPETSINVIIHVC